MKSFLDRFRRKDGDDSSEEASPAANAAEDGAPAESEPVASKPPVSPKETKEAEETLQLQLSDFLRRIPEHYLQDGPHDPALPLKFDLDSVADRVARGETTIPLVEIYKRIPQIFRMEVRTSDNVEIRFPWQKVMELINESAASATSQGAKEETLAQKLHKRRATRKTPGRNGEGEPDAPAARVPGGVRGGKQVSWFSRTAPGPGGANAPGTEAAKAKKPAPAPSTPAAETAPAEAPAAVVPPPPAPAEKPPEVQSLRLVLPDHAPDEEPETEAPEPVLAEAKAPVEPAAAAPAVPAAGSSLEGGSREEILRARDAALHQVARVRGEYERQIVSLQQEKVAAFEQRDRVQTELEQNRRALEEKLAHAAFEKSLSDHSSEKAVKDRENLGQELASLRQERDALVQQRDAQAREEARLAAEQEALAKRQQQLEEERAALTQAREGLGAAEEASRRLAEAQAAFAQDRQSLEEERTALTQAREKAAATEEAARRVAEEQAALTEAKQKLEQERATLNAERESFVQQAAALKAAPEGEAEAPAGTVGARSQKEYQRQISELNRRILALENNQRDRTQELTREKEIRLKTERQLSAAERSLIESGTQMEGLRNEAKRHLEAELQKREGEQERIREEQTRQFEALREEIRQAQSERDEAVAQAKGHEAAAQAAVHEAAQQSAFFQGETLAQFEADIANYRETHQGSPAGAGQPDK